MAKSQVQAIKEYLERGNTLTSREAFDLFGCTRLSAKIYELRNRYGMNIVCKWAKGKTRFGKNCYYGIYYLKIDK